MSSFHYEEGKLSVLAKSKTGVVSYTVDLAEGKVTSTAKKSHQVSGVRKTASLYALSTKNDQTIYVKPSDLNEVTSVKGS